MLFSKPLVSFSSNFAWPFSVIKYNFALHFFQSRLYTLHQRGQSKCNFLRLLSARIKVYQILFIFETKIGVFSSDFASLFSVTRNLISSMSWGIWWIFTEPLKNPNNSLWWAISVQIMQGWAKRNTEEFFHDNEQWCRIWINPDLVVSKMEWGISFHLSTQKYKNLYIKSLLLSKDIIFQLENESCVMTLKYDSKFKGKLIYGLKNDFRKLIDMQAVEILKICILIGSFCPKLIKIQMKKNQKSYVSWHCRVMQSLKKNQKLVPKLTWGIQWVFTQPLKSPNISLRLAILVQSI